MDTRAGRVCSVRSARRSGVVCICQTSACGAGSVSMARKMTAWPSSGSAVVSSQARSIMARQWPSSRSVVWMRGSDTCARIVGCAAACYVAGGVLAIAVGSVGVGVGFAADHVVGEGVDILPEGLGRVANAFENAFGLLCCAFAACAVVAGHGDGTESFGGCWAVVMILMEDSGG